MSSKRSAKDWVEDGDRLTAAGNYKDAVKGYDNALKADSKCKEAHLNKSVALQKAGNFKDALKCYDQAVKIDPTFKEAWLAKCLLSKKLMKFDDAAKSCAKAVEIDPGWEEAQNLMKELKELVATWEEFMQEQE